MDTTLMLEQTRLVVDRATERYAQITISPLVGGFGTTVGNALRRVLLSSLPGAAVTSVKIADVYHEFSVISHAREDTTRLILNLKQLRFKPQVYDSEREWHVNLMAQGSGVVTAADLQLPSDLDVVNPEQPIITLDSKEADLHMELVVKSGMGYSPAEDRGKLAIGELPVDAIFSPVRQVSFRVAKTRVGRLADYDSLTMEIWTDGSISPESALKQAANVLVSHFRFVANFGGDGQVARAAETERIPTWVFEMALEELDLSVRAYNCLKRAGLTRVGEILERMAQGYAEMLVIRNFGRKSLDELIEALTAKGLQEYIPPPSEADAMVMAEGVTEEA